MGRKSAQIGVIGVVGILFGAATVTAHAQSDARPELCAAREAVPAQLRPSDCRLAAAIADGMKRSSTFRRLVEQVGTLNGIVYIQLRQSVNLQTKRVLDGALSHSITTAGPYRLLHVIVGAVQGDRPIYILAHELQHAIEVLGAPHVSTEHDVDQLFERIGLHAFAGDAETQAALDIERTVRSELARRD